MASREKGGGDELSARGVGVVDGRERERERAGGEKERRSEFKDVCTHLLRRSHN